MSESDEELEWLEYEMIHHSERARMQSGEIITGLAENVFPLKKMKIRGKKKTCFVFFPLGNGYIDIIIERCRKKLSALNLNIFISVFCFKDLTC